MTYAVQFLMGKTHPRSFVNELFFVAAITLVWVIVIVLALLRLTGIVFIVFFVCGLSPLWDAIWRDERTTVRQKNIMTWFWVLSAGEFLLCHSLVADYGVNIPYFGIMPCLMVLFTLYIVLSAHKDHVVTLRRVAPQVVVSPPVESAVERVATPAVPVQQQARPAPAQRTIQTKSWDDIAKDMWQFQPLKEQYRLLIEGVKGTVWPGEEIKAGDIFFKGFIGDIKRLELPIPDQTDFLTGTFIEIAQLLLEQHDAEQFADLNDFKDAREALLKQKFSQ